MEFRPRPSGAAAAAAAPPPPTPPTWSLRALFHSASACASVMMFWYVAVWMALSWLLTAVARACVACVCIVCRFWIALRACGQKGEGRGGGSV